MRLHHPSEVAINTRTHATITRSLAAMQEKEPFVGTQGRLWFVTERNVGKVARVPSCLCLIYSDHSHFPLLLPSLFGI